MKWQWLHRAVVPFITSGLAALKLVWKLACAHSFPWSAEAVEIPTWVWQKLQAVCIVPQHVGFD